MSSYRDPLRWKSDFAGADPALRRALRAATRDRPSRADVKWMESGLSARLDPGVARRNLEQQQAAAHVVPPSAKLAAVLGKTAGVLLVGSTIAAVGLWAARKAPAAYAPAALQAPAQPQPPSTSLRTGGGVVEHHRTATFIMQHADRQLPVAARRHDPRPQAARGRDRIEVRADATTDPRDESPIASPAPTVEMPAPTSPPETAPPPRPAAAKELSETEVLMLARRALAKDPGAALGWVREHERRFSSPALAQEREIIAIDALRRLDRMREATARSERFFARYPSSIHGRNIESPVASEK